MSALAQLNLGEAYKLNPETGEAVKDVFASPADLVNVLMPNILTFAGVLLFIFIVVTGFKMVMNPMDKKTKEEGSKKIGYAIGGFLLIFVAYWIVQIIETILGVSIL